MALWLASKLIKNWSFEKIVPGIVFRVLFERFSFVINSHSVKVLDRRRRSYKN